MASRRRGESSAFPPLSFRRFGRVLARAAIALCLLLILDSYARGEIYMKMLRNGARLIVKPNRSNRILAIQCYFRVGSYYERSEENGITNLVCRTILKGTRKRSAIEIAETMEELGGEIDAAAAEDFAEVSTISTVDDLDVALDLLSDVIMNPTFPPDEVEKEREAILAAIRREEDNAFSYTYKHFRALVYQGHPYAMPVLGKPETVRAITPRRLAEFHRRHFTARNMVVVVVGDVEPAIVARKVERAFAKMRPGRGGRVLVTKNFRRRVKTEILTKDVEQGFVVLGYVTDRPVSPDYIPLKVACAILGSGGSMSSRLFVRLREKRALAYAVGAAMPTMRDKCHFFAYIGTRPEAVRDARDGLISVIRSLVTEPATPEELERAKNHIIGQFRIAHQRNSSQAHFLGLYEMVGLGAQFDERYCDLVRRVTAEQVEAVAEKYFRGPAIVMLIPSRAK